MTIVCRCYSYLIVKDHKEYGIFDQSIQMIVKWFKTLNEAKEEIEEMEKS